MPYQPTHHRCLPSIQRFWRFNRRSCRSRKAFELSRPVCTVYGSPLSKEKDTRILRVRLKSLMSRGATILLGVLCTVHRAADVSLQPQAMGKRRNQPKMQKSKREPGITFDLAIPSAGNRNSTLARTGIGDARQACPSHGQ